MEEQCSPLSWAYHFEQEGVEALKQSLLYSTALELEAAVIVAHEEVSRKDDETLQLKGLLADIIKDGDEFQTQCQQLHLQIQGHSSNDDVDDDNALSTSDSASALSPVSKDSLPLAWPLPDVTDTIPIKKAMPERGKFLHADVAVRPLPLWQHPPPQLSSVDIPPVTMSSSPVEALTPRLSHYKQWIQ